jgi:hypothetical protein
MALSQANATTHTVCSITLSGGLYENSIENLRETVTEMGRRGTIFVEVEPKISGDELCIAVNAGTLYVTAIKGANGNWYRFPDEEVDSNEPPLNATKASGGTNYNALGLANMEKQSSIVGKVIAELRGFNGGTHDLKTRKNLITLIFLVSEAARFRSMEQAMLHYIETGNIELKNYHGTVTAWQKSTLARSADVVLPYIETKPTSGSAARTKGKGHYGK